MFQAFNNLIKNHECDVDGTGLIVKCYVIYN